MLFLVPSSRHNVGTLHDKHNFWMKNTKNTSNEWMNKDKKVERFTFFWKLARFKVLCGEWFSIDMNIWVDYFYNSSSTKVHILRSFKCGAAPMLKTYNMRQNIHSISSSFISTYFTFFSSIIFSQQNNYLKY